MLKLGYWLMIVAGSLIGGYAAYFLICLIVTAPGIGTFFKVVILIGAAGLIITITGLVIERKKEGKNVSRDD